MVKIRAFRSHNEHWYNFSHLAETLSSVPPLQFYAYVTRITSHNLQGHMIPTCRQHWLKWWPPGHCLPLHLISIQHWRTSLAGAFLPSVSSNPRTWLICHENIGNAATSISPLWAGKDQAVDQARQLWRQKKAFSTEQIQGWFREGWAGCLY